MNRFRLTAALAPMLIGFLAVSAVAQADQQTKEARLVPHTGLWIKEVPGTEAFDPGSFFADFYKDDIVLLVTKVDGDPGPFPIQAGDVIEKVNGYLITTYDQLAKETEYYSDLRERVRVQVVRDNDEARPTIEIVKQ